MNTINAILFITLTSPFWGLPTLAVLAFIGFVALVIIVIVFLLDILKIGIKDAFVEMYVDILKLLENLFIGFYYVIINVWKFANDYPGWAIAISVVLIWIWISFIDDR